MKNDELLNFLIVAYKKPAFIPAKEEFFRRKQTFTLSEIKQLMFLIHELGEDLAVVEDSLLRQLNTCSFEEIEFFKQVYQNA